MTDNDLHDQIRQISGIPGLWLSVILDAVETIQAGPEAEGYSQAKSFIMEAGGLFDSFCEACDVDARELKKMIMKVGTRTREGTAIVGHSREPKNLS